MRRVVLAVVVVLAVGPLLTPALSQTPPRIPTRLTISGQVIVPVSSFQKTFEVLLVQNLDQVVQATVADGQGRYRFTGLTRGTYYIDVKIEGFRDVRQRVDLGSDSIVNIILEFQEEKVVKPPTDISGEDIEVVDAADLLKTYPSSIVEKMKAAEKDIGSANFAKALPILEEVVRDAPEFYQAHRMLGTTYQKLGRYRDAESEYRTAADLKQTSAAPLINLASLFLEEADASASQGSAVVRGILNEALACLGDAVKLKPDAPFAYYLLGVTYYKSAFYEEAEGHLKHSLELAPDLIDSHLALANVYIKIEEWSNAIAQLDAYIVASPRGAVREQVHEMRSRIVTRSQARLR